MFNRFILSIFIDYFSSFIVSRHKKNLLSIHIQGVKKVRRHHSKVPRVLKKVMLFTKLRYSKIEGTMEIIQLRNVCFLSNC